MTIAVKQRGLYGGIHSIQRKCQLCSLVGFMSMRAVTCALLDARGRQLLSETFEGVTLNKAAWRN